MYKLGKFTRALTSEVILPAVGMMIFFLTIAYLSLLIKG